MARWLKPVVALAVLAAPLAAQTNTPKSAYLVLRVKLGSEGGATPSGPGGGEGGPGGIPGGPPGYGGSGGIPSGPSGPGGFPGGPPSGPGGSGVGGPPGFGGAGFPGGTANTSAGTERSVHVLVPVTKIEFNKLIHADKGAHPTSNPPSFTRITHQFGTSILFPNKVNVQAEVLPIVTEETRLKEAYTKWNVDVNHKPTVLLAYIGDALKAELFSLAEQFSDSLARQFEKATDLPADVAAFIKGYNALKAKWNEPAANNPSADLWKAKFGSEANVHTDSPHYSVIHFTGDTLSGQAGETVLRASELLEKNLKSFYLWHLREGVSLPLPDKRMLVVVAKNGGQLSKLKEGLDGLTPAADATYSPVHNMLVLSPERTDELGRTFNAFAATKLEGFDRGELLNGKHPQPKQAKPEEIALASTYALIRRAIEDESLRSSVSREGTRQLLVTLGVLPQHVRLPKWVESGIGSVLQHPKGGGVVELSKDTPGIVVGVTRGLGAANYELLHQFLTFYPAKKDGKENKAIDAPAVLTNVLTDKYFAAIATGVDPDRPASITDLLPGLPRGPGGASPGGGVFGPGGGQSIPSAPAGPGAGPGGGQGGEKEPEAQGQGPRGGSSQQPPPGGLGGSSGGFGPGGEGGPGGFPGTGSVPGGTGIFDPNAVSPLLSTAQLESKAKATAWALTYYLTKNGKLSKLHAFMERLNELPRDLRVDSDMSLKLFCETFGLLKPNSQDIDKAAFNTFARDWMTFMHQQPPTYQTITLKKLNGEGNPNLPGGFGQPGGPGGLGGPGAGPGGGGGNGNSGN